MAQELFNPFKDLIFDDQFCFLSGDLTTDKITVFPQWLMDHFKFGDERVEMMDKAKSYYYRDLKMPCAPRVKDAFDALDAQVKTAYNAGFEGMLALNEEMLFQWTGRMVYGLLYYEMSYESNRLLKQGKNFELSVALRRRFGYFHLMLQSLIEPITFVGKKPWSIVLFPLKYSADIFSFRDDTINLMFSFGVNGFGFIASLQDDGVIEEKNKEVLEKMKGHVLHPVQFEELYARFHYTDYIMKYNPLYDIKFDGDQISISSDPATEPPQYGFWDEDIFAQLLSNYWQVYGIEREDILKPQKPALSFLENPYTKDFVDPMSIALPF